jgi:hypothetical protein
MGFYIKDLYVNAATWPPHDPLTNPPTVPETTPWVLVAAKLRDVAVQNGQAGDLDEQHTTAPTVPTTFPFGSGAAVIDEADYARIHTVLTQTLAAVENAMAAMKPEDGQVEYARNLLAGEPNT